MTTQLERTRRERIDQIVEQVRDATAAGRKDEAERFARHFYRHVSPTDLQRESPHDLAGAVLSVWELCQKREHGKPSIRVFHPDTDRDGWTSPHSVVEIVNDDMPFLVDSVTGMLGQMGVEVYLVIHPIVRVVRDKKGVLTDWSISA
ncbi:MAG: hypothetical protein ACYS0F_19885, partial [Planctomycetota bacterium]